ncbi:MAG: hypothetical protein HY904_07715 [Deltaproteobacteria bacterium]|nr:hypothetical protein [Deltaproteobacteria bacterium]
MKALPERRLLVRAGQALLTLDLTQIREVSGGADAAALPLCDALDIPPAGPPSAALVVETGGAPVTVAVDAVAGVVEVARADVLALGPHVRLRAPGIVRAVMRVPRPSQWRGASLLPGPAGAVGLPVTATPGEGTTLAADIDPVELGKRLAAITGGA